MCIYVCDYIFVCAYVGVCECGKSVNEHECLHNTNVFILNRIFFFSFFFFTFVAIETVLKERCLTCGNKSIQLTSEYQGTISISCRLASDIRAESEATACDC